MARQTHAGTELNEEEFRSFLRRSGRSAGVASRCVSAVFDFEQWLGGRDAPNAGAIAADHITDYVAEVETAPQVSAKTRLWALAHYFEFLDDPDSQALCRTLRRERIDRKPFPLREFRGVEPGVADRLARMGITNVDEMRTAGCTPEDRAALAAQTDFPIEKITELVELSDLARIPGIKGIRARLYDDAGIATVGALADWDPDDFREYLVRFCADTGFAGVAPLPQEVKYSVTVAHSLPEAIEM
jgi:predicted flap endonuclease-1-like 5' DNA nuclease